MNLITKTFVFAVFVILSVSVADAQGTCTMATLAGTYAFQSRGSSSIILGEAPAPPPFHWSALVAPISIIGQLTISPNGEVNGPYWGMLGSENFGLNALPAHGQVTQLNRDCTGIVRFGNFTERFISIDNGREFRSVTVQTDFPTAVWVTTLRRISNHYQSPVTSCGQQTMRGVYLLRCEGLQPLPGPAYPYFGGGTLFRVEVSGTGDYTGTVWGKAGPISLDPPAPVSGKFQVNPDCTVGGTLTGPHFPGQTHARGVLFDEGKELYLQPIVTLGPAPGVSTPIPYASCQATRIDR